MCGRHGSDAACRASRDRRRNRLARQARWRDHSKAAGIGKNAGAFHSHGVRGHARKGRRSRHGQRCHAHVVAVEIRGPLVPPRDGSSAKFSRGSADKHDIVAGWIERPVVALAGIVVRPGNLDEALIERKIMSNGVLPALLVLSVVGKVLHYVVVYSAQREFSLGARADRHHD